MLMSINGFMKRKKTQKGISTMDLSIYIVIASLLVAAGLMAYNNYQDRARRNTTQSEMDMLAQACVMFQGDNKAGTTPANLGALVTGLTAVQSYDGVAKTSYVAKTGWTSDPATFTDGWGNAYVYDSAARTITSTNNGSGTSIVKSF